MNMNFIELFAGCGGLSLGLKKAGFELLMANELSPMAAETYAFNLLGEDLSAYAKADRKSEKTIWINSAHRALKDRLRENPYSYPAMNSGFSDLTERSFDLKGKLLVGSILHLNSVIEEQESFRETLKKGFNSNGVDLVSGGPPCQSFSLAGMRDKNSSRNQLPWEFAQFVDYVQPKIVVLENVTGILRPFKEGGVNYYAWFEVAKAFAKKKYIPLCIQVNARLTGVPQNRPRFIMIGLREDIYPTLVKKFTRKEISIFEPSIALFNSVKADCPQEYGIFPCYDLTRKEKNDLYCGTFLAPLCNGSEVTAAEALGDLMFGNAVNPSSYVINLNNKFSDLLNVSRRNRPTNHELRNNNPHVKRRFRIYQIISRCDKATEKNVVSILKGVNLSLSSSSWNELKDHLFLDLKGKLSKFANKKSLEDFLLLHPTKKQIQKALLAHLPAPAALSIPDDACHYDEAEIRTLTVREMARIQSFPDDFIFRSKVTTGGKMRRFEVPQYTQVGNAVPPLLGLKLGTVVKELLERM